jgi:outer membrane immunogenic protein
MRNKLISTLAGAAFSFAASGFAFAADIAVKAAAPSPAAVYNWTGWYVGGNAGASLGTFKTDFNGAPGTFVVSTGGPPFATATIPGFAGRDEVYPGGFIGGVQIGFNWQFSPPMGCGARGRFSGCRRKRAQ